jgi:photosystem II stability/assembly factor-like uncharacterized protein
MQFWSKRRLPLSGRRRALVLSLGAFLSALVVLSAAAGGVNAPYSGWYSGNPTLGPNRLSDLACAGNTCYASGDFGTVLKSTDGGATWTGLVTGLTVNLPRIRLIGGDASNIVTGGGCAVRRSDDGGETFARLPFVPNDSSCPFSVSALSFPSSNVGYLMLSDGNVVSTADGGQTFSRKTAVPGGGGPSPDLLCTTDTLCLAVTAAGTVQRTTDGGGSWTQVANAGVSLRTLEAVGTTLYAAGNNLTVMKSTDGGATWERKPVTGTPPGNLTSIRCANADTCLISTEAGNQLLRTTDGGATYTSIVPSTDPIFAVDFASPARVVVAGAFGSAAISEDGGENWRAVGRRIAGSFFVLHAASETLAYAGGANGVLARTVDAGQTWANVSAPTAANVIGIAAPTTNRVFVLADDGTAQRSDNGGVSYKLLNTGTTARPLAIAALNNETVLLVGPTGLRRSADGGESFRTVAQTAVQGARLAAIDNAGATAIVFGVKVAAMSTNGGSAWQRIKLPKKRSIRDLDFVSSRQGFLLDTKGVLWTTANGGVKWERLLTTGAGGYLTEFTDGRNGYVVPAGGVAALQGVVLRTADAGRSWHPQLLSQGPVRALESSGSTDYALVGEWAQFATQSRGDIGAPRSLSIRTKSRVLEKAGRISVSGQLTAAAGGEEVVVAQYAGGRWLRQTARVAANGTFATRWTVRGNALFVAQALGDADHVGAGTSVLAVTLKKKPTRKR